MCERYRHTVLGFEELRRWVVVLYVYKLVREASWAEYGQHTLVHGGYLGFPLRLCLDIQCQILDAVVVAYTYIR